MLVQPREVATILAVILGLMAAKYVPFLAVLPLANIIGVICFAFAIYLSLRLYRAELARIRSE